MDPLQIHAALKEVRNLRTEILEKQRFRGYSGRARALGGCIALLGGVVLQLSHFNDARITLFVWAVVFCAAVGINYGAVLYWKFHNVSGTSNHIPQLVETLVIWMAAGVLTGALWTHGHPDLLYGMWFLMFGVAQTVTRTTLPHGIAWVAVWYLLTGVVCLAFPQRLFVDFPVVMGLVFFLGEFGGGLVFHIEGDWRRLREFFSRVAKWRTFNE